MHDVLYCVAVCCRVLWRVAVCIERAMDSVLHCIAKYIGQAMHNVLHCVAVCCRVLRRVAVCAWQAMHLIRWLLFVGSLKS